jgi:hypothetical protein
MRLYAFAYVAVALPSLSMGFAPQLLPVTFSLSIVVNQRVFVSKMSSDATENNEYQDDTTELLLSASDLSAQMTKLRNKYPTSEADYLAAARARNVAKQASSEGTASDADWHQIAAEKKQAVGEIDDWESSKSEAGNSDSQILIPLASTIGDDGEEEPKLMLF